MILKKKILTSTMLALPLSGIISLIVFSIPIFAGANLDGNPILKKALMEGVYKCYTSQNLAGQNIIYSGPFTAAEYKSWSETIITKGASTVSIPLPNTFTKVNILNSNISCRELFSGGSGFDGLFPLLGIDDAAEAGKNNLLTGMGYDSPMYANGRCIAVKATRHPSFVETAFGAKAIDLFLTPSLCSRGTSTDNGPIASVLEVVRDTPADSLSIISDYAVEFSVANIIGKPFVVSVNCYVNKVPTLLDYNKCGNHQYSIGTNWEDFSRSIFKDISDNFDKLEGLGGRQYTNLELYRHNMSEVATVYSFADHLSAAIRAVYYLSSVYGGVGINLQSADINFTNEETFALYQSYLNNFYKIQTPTCDPSDAELTALKDSGTAYGPIRLYVNGSFINTCYVVPTTNTSRNVNGVSSGRRFGTSMTLDQIIAWLQSGNAMSVTSLSSTLVSIIGNPQGSRSPTAESGKKSACFGSAGVLGWIICPLIELVSTATNALYKNVVEQFLKIDAKVFSTDNGAFMAWQSFQVFANIAFIIFLLIVIFSQITGVGIDNYGIKKILPKLIIAAILINLSYFICQLAVDVSNIFGVGLNQLFDRMAENINLGDNPLGLDTGTNVITSILFGASAGLGIVALAFVGLGVLIVPLLLGLISALFAVLFFFILLSARQAGVIILVVISPLAFACYILPNTKRFFDRWFKMFTGLLIFYPICAVFIGGGNLASRILVSTASGDGMSTFFAGLIALLIGVVPFFFLPTLLRDSFSAMGGIFARVAGYTTGMSSKLSGKATSAARPALERSELIQGKIGGGRRRLARQYEKAERVRYGQEKYQYEKAKGSLAGYTERIAKGEILEAPEMRDAAIAARTVAGGDKQLIDDAKIMILKATNNGGNESAVQTQLFNAVARNDVTSARAAAEIMGGQKFQAISFDKWMLDNQFSDNLQLNKSPEQQRAMVEGIAKTMTTGDGARNYRAANALQFEHASNLLKDKGTPNKTPDQFSLDWANSNAKDSYGKDRAIKDQYGNPTGRHYTNADSALNNHVTNGSELVGQGSDVLQGLANKELKIDTSTEDRVKGLAANVIKAYEGGQYTDLDTTKLNYIRQIAGEQPVKIDQEKNNAEGEVLNVRAEPAPAAAASDNPAASPSSPASAPAPSTPTNTPSSPTPPKLVPSARKLMHPTAPPGKPPTTPDSPSASNSMSW